MTGWGRRMEVLLAYRDGDVCLDDRWLGVILRDRRGDCGGEAGCLGIERGCNGAKVLVRV